MPTRSKPNPSATAAHARTSTARARNSPPANARATSWRASSWMCGWLATAIPHPSRPQAFESSARTPLLRVAGPRENLLDDAGLGIGVLLREVPVLLRQRALGPLVQPAVFVVSAQVIAEREHALDLGAAR